jgi:Ni,Fe-hydrogenase maturation factor
MDTLVVGVGNPILSDDGVGVCAARVIHGRQSPGGPLPAANLRVDVQDVETFGQVLSGPVAAAVPTLVEMILALLTGSDGGERAHRGVLL